MNQSHISFSLMYEYDTIEHSCMFSLQCGILLTSSLRHQCYLKSSTASGPCNRKPLFSLLKMCPPVISPRTQEREILMGRGRKGKCEPETIEGWVVEREAQAGRIESFDKRNGGNIKSIIGNSMCPPVCHSIYFLDTKKEREKEGCLYLSHQFVLNWFGRGGDEGGRAQEETRSPLLGNWIHVSREIFSKLCEGIDRQRALSRV